MTLIQFQSSGTELELKLQTSELNKVMFISRSGSGSNEIEHTIENNYLGEGYTNVQNRHGSKTIDTAIKRWRLQSYRTLGKIPMRLIDR